MPLAPLSFLVAADHVSRSFALNGSQTAPGGSGPSVLGAVELFGLPSTVLLGVMAITVAIPLLWWSRNDPLARHRSRLLNQLVDVVQAGDQRAIALAQGRKQRLLEPMLQGFAFQIERIAPSSFVQKLDHRIHAAGKGGTWTPARLLGIQVLGLVIGSVCAAFVLSGGTARTELALAGFLVFGGFVLPSKLVTQSAVGRQKQIGKDLADIIDQVTISVEAGLGFDAALTRVAKESTSPLGEELGRTMQDVQLGISRDDAFDRLLSRTDVEDLRQFVSALQQASRLGIPLGRVLRVQSAELRQRRQARAQEKAMKLGVKLTFPTVLFILPALLLAVLGPAIISVMESGFGG